MTFSDVLGDIKQLVGLELQSIRPGANIRIIEVDEERSCLILQTASGMTRSRPLGELHQIWNEMNRVPAVHVDEVLHGSGTSRNQPETILANLPYIEWLKVDNKKHIAYVGKKTHAYGTLKQMDSIEASHLKLSRKKNDVTKMKIVIVSSNLSDTNSSLNSKLSGTVSAVTQGIYTFECTSFDAVIVSSSIIQLSPGTYPILSSSPIEGAKVVLIREEEYYAIDTESIKFLVEKK